MFNVTLTPQWDMPELLKIVYDQLYEVHISWVKRARKGGQGKVSIYKLNVDLREI